jgi:hypothetical protein
MKRISRYLVLSIAGAAIFSLAAENLPAQSSAPVDNAALVREAVPPAPASATEAKVLVTDQAAQVGIQRAKSSEAASASGAQITTDPTMKWVIIIGVAVLAALLIVALAD